MKVVIATALFPPDIAEPAPYTKTLARRLAGEHEVTVVLYGRLPESVPAVRYVCVDKRRALPFRLIAYTRALLHEARHADVLHVENGSSVELPVLVVSLISRTPFVLHIGDTRAHTQDSPLTRLLARLVTFRAASVVEELPHARPEILPFAPYPTRELEKYEHSWQAHIQTLTSAYKHAHN